MRPTKLSLQRWLTVADPNLEKYARIDREMRSYRDDPDESDKTLVGVKLSGIALLATEATMAAILTVVTFIKNRTLTGKTRQYSGTTPSTADISLPSAPAGQIQKFTLECRADSPDGSSLGISLDGGTVFYYMVPGTSITWEPKKTDLGADIQQIIVRPSVAGILYQAMVNYEP